MQYELKKMDKSQVELVITVEPTEYQKEMLVAAERISERSNIKGFRPGHAPYDTVKQQLGEVRILEEAMQHIVEKNFFEAAKKENLDTVGMPQITIEKAAPGNEFIFKAVVALLPMVKIADLEKIKVKRQEKEVSDQQVDDVLENLKKMQGKETIKTGPAKKEDKVTINMDMFLDKVPVEGGQAKNHAVYLSEEHYIPGMADQLVGLQKDEAKEFTLKFPANHYQKMLAGKDIDFKIKVNDVYEIQYPALDDEFAKALGQPDLAGMKKLLRENLSKEAAQKEDQRLEIEIFEKLAEASEFGELPDVLVNSEKQKMFHELEHNLEHQGISIEQYLKDLKKTEQEIFNDFSEGATKRVKAALLSREIAKANDLAPKKEEIDAELELIRKTYPGDKTVEENLKKTEVISSIAVTIQNRKVVQWLKDKVVGK